MSIWMEIRCTVQGERGAAGQCLSNHNGGPMGFASGVTQEAVLVALKVLTESAKYRKWKKTKAGFICPICIKNGHST
jgi:hypothetical protein